MAKTSWRSKVAGVITAGAVVASLLPTMALGVGASSPDASISVTGVPSGATVEAYQFVVVDQSNTASNGTAGWNFTGKPSNYTWQGIRLVDLIGTGATIDATEAATIAANKPGTAVPLTYSDSDGTYSASNVAAGLYVVLVRGTGSTIYNPMIVGVDYDGSNSSNTIAAGSTYSGSTAVAKSSEPTLTKTAKQPNDKTVQAGDTVEFEIGTSVPFYPAAYFTNASFVITDTLDEGLSLPTAKSGVEVKAGTAILTEGTDYDLTLSGQTMTISFKSSYLNDESRTNKGGLTNSETAVTVTYSATVSNAEAFRANVTEMTNDAKIKFTNNPGTTKDSDHVKTHHYTFGLDANLAGNGSGSSKELRKIAVNDKGNAMYETASQSNWTSQTPLEGAVFSLTGTSTDGVAYNKSFTTNSEGMITFTGLDADVNYTLKETSAPAGYTLDTTEHTVRIEATYVNGTDVLASYKVIIDNQPLATVNVTNESEEISSVTYTSDSLTGLFKNVKAGLLPSTGGSGIIFYLVVGGAVAGTAYYLLNKDKKETEASIAE